MRLGILGGGRAAWAYGSAWARIGWPITGVWLRPESGSRLPELLAAPRRPIAELAAESEILLVAVSDRAIDEVSARVPPTEAIVFHASGALPSPPDGFSLHPLKSLPPVGEEVDLRDALLVFEGAHRKTAKLIAAAIDARFAEVSAGQKPLYHAAAVFGSNYVAVMLDIAEAMMRKSGIDDARPHLVALARSAVRNWELHDDAGRFTGPAVRRDEETLRRHLDALAGHVQVADIYKLLADWIASSTVSTPE
jgi:predicted short-subunit dehydrogenase-like oxidoreductase (DUF2520 family)